PLLPPNIDPYSFFERKLIMNYSKTYCNPLPIPHYQRAGASWRKDPRDHKWMTDRPRDFREMADPTCIKVGKRWYLYPSCGMCWYSDDFIHWTHHPIEPRDIGYAPTVAEKGGWFYMTACGHEMWRAPVPLGPWSLLGRIRDE